MERSRPSRMLRRVAVVGTALAAFSLAFGPSPAGAQPARPRPDFNALVAQARHLARQIDALSQQFDGLQVRLRETRDAAKAAAKTAARDRAALASGTARVSQIAAQSYMGGGYDPTLQLATSNDPQRFLDRATIMSHLQSQNGAVLSGLEAAQAAANRAQEAAKQQAAQVARLAKQIDAKRAEIQGKVNIVESAAYKQALAIASRTGRFPVTAPVGNSLGAQALRYALTRQGDAYVWGAAGPDTFDCSGLVLWAYSKVGISLPHYTGDQFNSGVHISRSQLEAGDLVFFYSDISHVGMYVGNGLMVDAPDFGETVKVEPVMWDVYAGAVRIAI
ncbi:MAG: C40 family peptidase [Micromonosporaceae bacterium]